MNKYHAIKTYSNLCDRTFDSKGEAGRADELYLLQRGGAISGVEYQIKFKLSDTPRITVSIDFKYTDTETGEVVYEDFKGVLTRDSRTKYAWLKEQTGITVLLSRRN